MKRVVAILAGFLILVFITGCSAETNSPEKKGETAPSIESSRISTPTISGETFSLDGFSYDSPADDETLKALRRVAKKALTDPLEYEYLYDLKTGKKLSGIDEETAPKAIIDALPSTRKEFFEELDFFVIPAYEYSKIDPEAKDLFAVTRPMAGQYVLGITYKGKLFSSCDFRRNEGENTLRDDFYSFYGPLWGNPSLVSSQEKLQEKLGDRPVVIRIIRVPRGWWVVGYANGEEAAVFECEQGSYVDDPRWDKVYSVNEVLEYGAPHADGK